VLPPPTTATVMASEGVTGTYFVNSKPKTSSRSSYVPAAGRLWQISVDLVACTAGI
jgi:hypothetical protein